MKKISFHLTKDDINYFIFISVAATAYQIYSVGLSSLSWVYAGFLFSVVGWLSVLVFHDIVRRKIVKLINFKEEVKGPDKSWSQLTTKEFISILFLGLVSFGYFALMLPFLKNQEVAIYFTIVGSAVFRIISVLVAQKLFNDQIDNRLYFWIGFIICVIGLFLFKHEEFINGTPNYKLLLWSLCWGVCSVVNDQAKRYVTIEFSKRKVKLPCLSNTFISIKTLQSKTELITAILFLISMIILYFKNEFSFSIPVFREIVSSIWIGFIVLIVGGTIAIEFKNKIGETKGSILQSIRIISSMISVPIISLLYFSGDFKLIWYDLLKWIGILVILGGGLISFAAGNPHKEKV